MCGGADAGGGAELHNMWSLIRNASEYTEELWRCIGDASEKCRVQYAGSYSDSHAPSRGQHSPPHSYLPSPPHPSTSQSVPVVSNEPLACNLHLLGGESGQWWN